MIQEEDDDAGGRPREPCYTAQGFLETAFSSTFTNADRKKWVEHIGVPCLF